MKEVATGYAVITDGEIDVRTVTLHARTSMIYWLWYFTHTAILAGTTDAEIERTWTEKRGEFGNPDVIEVTITPRR